MRLISLRSFKYISPIRFTLPRRKFKISWSPIKQSKKYLRFSIPLTLMSLTYAISSLSSKAYQSDQIQKISFKQLIQQVSEGEEILEKLESAFFTIISSIELLISSAVSSEKSEKRPIEQILKEHESEICQLTQNAQVEIIQLLHERYLLREKLRSLNELQIPNQNEAYVAIQGLWTNAQKLIPKLVSYIEVSQKIIESMTNLGIFSEILPNEEKN